MKDFDVQSAALEGTLLLEASAGTGKTWNLVRIVERVIRDGVSPEKILLVTFTEDAVNELRNRQRELTPDAGQMTITTIHGFCQAMLRYLPFESGVPFEFSPVPGGTGLEIGLLRAFLRRYPFGDRAAEKGWETLLLEEGDASAVDYLLKGIRLFCEDPSLNLSDAETDENGLKRLFELILKELPDTLNKRKRSEGAVDFSGMIELVYGLVTGKGGDSDLFIRAVRNRYDVALIDEFQDTDSRQWAIFSRLFQSPGKRLILIGDPKQSIYGFRGTDLGQYLAARNTVPENSRWCLRRNFRSTEPMIRAFDRLFAPLFPDYPEQGKGDKEVPVLRDPSGREVPPVNWITLDPDITLQVPLRREWFSVIVDILYRLLSENWTLGGEKVRPGDFLILVNKNDQGELLREMLRNRGIPSVTCSGEKVTDQEEALHFLELVEALVHPDRRGAVCGALLSLFFGFSPEEVYQLEESGAMDRVHIQFAAWKGMLDHGDLLGVLEHVYEEGVLLAESLGQSRLPLPERLLSEPGGERTLTNIRHLAELYQEELRRGGLDGQALFQRMLSGSLRFPAEEEHEIRLDREGDLVRIMTVFKAKGLQAPLVFHAGILSSYSQNRYPVVWMDQDRGGRWFSPELTAREKDLVRLNEYRERKRLYYVALTRAESALWLPLPAAGLRSPGNFFFYDIMAETVLEGLKRNWAEKGDLIVVPLKLIGNGFFSKSKKAPLEQGDLYGKLCELFYSYLEEMERLQLAGVAAPSPVRGGDLSVLNTQGGIREKDLVSPEQRFPSAPEKRIIPVNSFSSLVRQREEREAEPDVRERAPEIAPEVRAALKADDPLAGLAGPVFGDMMHELLEILDLNLPAGCSEEEFCRLPEVRNPVLLALRRFYAAGKDKQFYPSVTSLLYRVLTVPIPALGGLSLSSVPRDKMIREMEFLYPDPQRSEGLIKGYIDLIFEANGKVYLADWKTNLPDSDDPRAPFDQPVMDRIMEKHRYGLQESIYREALRKYLEKSRQERVIFGGSFYFFLRGMDKEGRGMYFIPID